MEPHPIPQNVTNFQFRLVGDMTLKQFLYLATGCGIAYFIFVFVSYSYPLVAWPLIIISAALGAAFAFLPFASRPLDYWLVAFLKAIYSPTKRLWVKNKKNYKEYPLFKSRLVTYLSSMQHQTPTNIQPSPIIVTPKPTPLQEAAASSPKVTVPQPVLTSNELGKTVDLARQAQNIQLRILQNERMLNQIKAEASQPSAAPVDYSQQVNKVMSDLQSLIAQSSSVKQQINTVTKTPPIPLQPLKPNAALTTNVKIVAPTKTKQTQLALTTFPNVINGIVKDNAGNYLESCIAVIHDKDGLPVRALKTNKLGQFTGSTPLPNGTYKLTIEKDNMTFDVLQIDLQGEVLPPLLIVSK